MEILRTINLSKTFGSGASQVEAVRSANFSVEEESVNIIIGNSGSGKTTFLNLLSGIEKPTSGSVMFNGENIHEMSEKDQVELRRSSFGFIFQFFNLIPELNIYDNIALPMIFRYKKADRDRVTMLAEDLDIADKLDSFPHMLSGGQQQRAAIARAMINKPQIIFADEPTGNLDETNSRMVMDLLLKSCKQHKQALVMVTHDHGLIKEGTKLFEMRDGNIDYADNGSSVTGDDRKCLEE